MEKNTFIFLIQSIQNSDCQTKGRNPLIINHTPPQKTGRKNHKPKSSFQWRTWNIHKTWSNSRGYYSDIIRAVKKEKRKEKKTSRQTLHRTQADEPSRPRTLWPRIMLHKGQACCVAITHSNMSSCVCGAARCIGGGLGGVAGEICICFITSSRLCD